MGIGVEHAVEHDLGQDDVEQRAGEVGPVGRVVVDRLCGADRVAVEAFHHQHPSGAQACMGNRDLDRRGRRGRSARRYPGHDCGRRLGVGQHEPASGRLDGPDHVEVGATSRDAEDEVGAAWRRATARRSAIRTGPLLTSGWLSWLQ